MIRKSTHDVRNVLQTYEEVMQESDENHHYERVKHEFCGDRIKFSSHRLWTFYASGVECVNCGIVGKFFAKEKYTEDEESYHLNLYALDDEDEIMMTKDHIIPKSKGGDNHISNYQTMCRPCNMEKGDG